MMASQLSEGWMFSAYVDSDLVQFKVTLRPYFRSSFWAPVVLYCNVRRQMDGGPG